GYVDLRRWGPLLRHLLQRCVGRRPGPRARAVHTGARDVLREWRVPGVGIGALDLGYHVVDLLHDLWRNLVHPMGLARVVVDLFKQLLVVLAACHPLAAQYDIATPELLHRPS